jgi:5-methylcytosine-specific restriction enzyme B
VRFALTQRGFITGERGTWRLTEKARRYLEAHRDDPIAAPSNVPEIDAEDSPDYEGEIETVDVTGQTAFYVPILEALAKGTTTTKREILAEAHELLRERLLPGDERRMARGHLVWRYRGSWALTALHRDGAVRNVGLGQWEITDAGRQRLEKERAAWQRAELPRGKAKVRKLENTSSEPNDDEDDDPPPRPWDPARWAAAKRHIPGSIYTALSQRLRPELGPTPSIPLPRNVVLYGPPGTGKTWIAKQVACALTGEDAPGPDSLWSLVQFHPSYAYEDFIQGLRPDLEQAELHYKLSQGSFLQLCETAADDPDHFYVMVIDEINRGDPARIFGELLYALEYRGQSVDLAIGGQLSIPLNVVILGTMNSVDRSVALVDYALRRRFGFIRVAPEPELITDLRGHEADAAVAAKVLHLMNDWLTAELGVEHTLGHSFFLNPSISLETSEGLDAIWSLDVMPLLEEYFYGDAERIKQARSQWRRAIEQARADTEETEA